MTPDYTVRTGPNRQEIRKAESIIDAFSKIMKAKLKRMLVSKEVATVIAPNEEALLDLRRALVRSVEVGMLERKDQEEITGILSAMIWFNRLEAERQARIINEWG